MKSYLCDINNLIMKSYFFTGTDTGVGKTYIIACIATALKKLNIDVGVMKPFASGQMQKSGYKSSDIEIIAKASQTKDPENLINPFFFDINASPYSFIKKFNTKIKIDDALIKYHKLSKLHDIMLIEGIGGIMTPITKEYSLIDFIKDINIDVILIATAKIGTINHILMTYEVCKKYGIDISGIIINDITSNNYVVSELQDDLENLIQLPIICTLSYDNINSVDINIDKKINFTKLFYL